MTASYPQLSKESRPQLPPQPLPLRRFDSSVSTDQTKKKALQQRLFTHKNNKPFACNNLLLGNLSFSHLLSKRSIQSKNHMKILFKAKLKLRFNIMDSKTAEKEYIFSQFTLPIVPLTSYSTGTPNDLLTLTYSAQA
jgi:hypothetical protein